MVMGPESMERQLHKCLSELVKVLERAESTISVTIAALRHQDAERDKDIAQVLQTGAGDCLSAEIEKMNALLQAPLSSSVRKVRSS